MAVTNIKNKTNKTEKTVDVVNEQVPEIGGGGMATEADEGALRIPGVTEEKIQAGVVKDIPETDKETAVRIKDEQIDKREESRVAKRAEAEAKAKQKGEDLATERQEARDRAKKRAAEGETEHVSTIKMAIDEDKIKADAKKEVEDEIATGEDAENKTIGEFSGLLESGESIENLAAFVNKNPKLKDKFTAIARDRFKNKAGAEFFGKYSSMTNQQLSDAVSGGQVTVGSDLYNMLPLSQRKQFEEFQQQKQTTNISNKADFTNDNNNIISLSDLVKEVKNLFSTDLRKKYEELINSDEIISTAQDLEVLQNDINTVDDDIDKIEDEVNKEFPTLNKSATNSIIAQRTKEQLRKKNTLVNQYNSKLGTYKTLKDSATQELEFFKYEDAQNKAIYNTALTMYETRRKEMTAEQTAKFKAQNDKIAANRKLADDKALFDYKQKTAEGKGDLKIINDKLYFVEGKEATLVIDAGDKIGGYDDKDWKINSYKNNDGTFTSVFTNVKTQQVYQKTTDATGEQAGGYLENLGLGTITGYGGDYDSGLGLDIDGAMGQPFTAPMGGVVKGVGTDKMYGNYIDLELDDGNFIRYSHLQDTYLQEGDKFSMKENLGTIGNTGNVRALDPKDPAGRVPTADELKKGVGSHLDIVTQTPNGLYRTAKQTQEYLAGMGDGVILNKERFNMQTEILDRFTKDPEVKAFKESFIQSKNLITSLGSDTGAGDMAGIFQFMKSLDPRSVVREGEFALAGNSAGLATGTMTQLKGILTGEKLDESLRKDFEQLAIQYLKNRGTMYDEAYNNNKILYEQQGLPMSAYPPKLTDEINKMLKGNQKLSSGKTFDQKAYEESTWAPIG